jgi:hopene-associated glycosyltransferase HpnB
MASVLTATAGLSLIIWAYLTLFRGGFWRADARLGGTAPEPAEWPTVTALVPARDEAPVIGEAVTALLAQDYPGDLRVIVIDDGSEDGTAAVAEAAEHRTGAPGRLAVIAARPPAPGWTGKLWALSEGLAQAPTDGSGPRYLWLSDADIAHGPTTLRRLVAKAEGEGFDLVSLMVALSCAGWWERLLIPPFVYFFQMLYPFAWVADPKRRTAAAAGGCVLVKAETLAAAGGFAAIKGALIDDCALATRIKAGGSRIWLGLAEDSRSLRPYDGLKPIWDMVARSAYTQLRHAPLLLLGTLLGMTLTFLAPPLIGLTVGLHGDNPAALLGFVIWSLMAVSALPTYRLYRQPVWLPALLPLAAAFYSAMTFDSAWRHWRGRGGGWKGRHHAGPLEERRAGR